MSQDLEHLTAPMMSRRLQARQNRIPGPDVVATYVATVAGCFAYIYGVRDIGLSRSTVSVNSDAANGMYGQIGNIICLALCVVSFWIFLAQKNYSVRGKLVIFALFTYYAVCFILPIFWNSQYIFNLRLIYPIIALSFLLSPIKNIPLTVRHLTIACSIPAISSIALAYFRPQVAILTDYQSFIPGIEGRLYGATAHANILGFSCLFPIMLIASFKPKGRYLNYLLMLTNITALVLSQSKTALVCCLIGYFVILGQRSGFLRGGNNVIPNILLSIFLICVATIVVVQIKSAETNLVLDNGGALSLTGRNEIWQAAWNLSKDSIWLGPGWENFLNYMGKYYPRLVANAHNLFVASFIQAGTLGIVSAVMALFVIQYHCIRCLREQVSFAIAFFIVICFRSVSEAFLFQDAFTSPTFMVYLMFFKLSITSYADAQRT